MDFLLDKLRSAQTIAAIADHVAIDDPIDAMICRMWPDFDTADIARKADMQESIIANRLARLRDEGAL